MKCIIEECTNTLSPRSRSRICPHCGATLIRWYKRPIGAVRKRVENLGLYSSRMEALGVYGEYRKKKIRRGV